MAGKTAVVLGASTEGGSGWRTAELFAAEGARVVVGARRFEGVEALAGKIGGLAVRCDASDEDQVKAMAAAAARQYGKIDAAILAAGMPVVGTFDTIDSEEFRKAAANNYFSVYYFIRQMTRQMADNGSIVFISSLATTHPMPGYMAYAGAKAGANALIKYAALEYAPRGIRVNGILAGAIQSPMNAAMQANKAAWAALMKEVPLGRAVQTSQMAETCLWLSTPQAAITGVCLEVDNGNHLRRFVHMDEMPSGIYDESARTAGY